MTARSYFMSSVALLAMGALATPALAQLAIEEIVVTARKTEERLQDVPIAVNAFTSRDIEERGIDDALKLTQFTPGFTFEGLGRYGAQNGVARPVIRGQSNILGEANAAVFVDGIPYTSNILSFPFDLVERVEVIKGPQAALYGRSTFAGAINLITKKGSNEFEHKISARGAEYGEYELSLLSRGPIMEDKVFYVAHGRVFDNHGMYRNRVDNRRVGDQHSENLNGAVEFRASENFTATISGGWTKDDDGHSAIRLQERTANNCFLNVRQQYYCGEIVPEDSVELNIDQLQGQEGLRREIVRAMATLEYDAGAFTITSNTGAFWTDQEYGYDSDFTSADPVTNGSTRRLEVDNRDEWSTELRVATPQDQSIRYLAGAFYYKRRKPSEERHFSAAPTIDFGTDRVNNWAVFGSVAADITDALTGTVEMRYNVDKIGNFKETVTINVTGQPPRVENDVLVENTFKTWLPRFTLDYKITDNTMVYGVVAKGNKPGVINPDPDFPPEIQFADEESSWNYEIGTKNTLFDGRLTLNASAYYIDWSKQQLTTQFTFPPALNRASQSYIINAAKTKVEGFEVEANGIVNEYLSGGIGYSYNDATFKELNDVEGGVLFGNPSMAGKQTPNSAKHHATVNGRIGVPVTDELEAFFRADYSYTSEKFDQVYNLASTGDKEVLNLKLGLQAENWLLTLYVDNVTDDRAPSTIIRFLDFQNPLPIGTSQRTSTTMRGFQYPLADKRQFGLSASYTF